MKNNPNYELLDIADDLRKSSVYYDTTDDYEVSVKELSDVINNVIFDGLKQGRDAKDILRALNELGNVLVSQTQDYDEFKE